MLHQETVLRVPVLGQHQQLGDDKLDLGRAAGGQRVSRSRLHELCSYGHNNGLDKPVLIRSGTASITMGLQNNQGGAEPNEAVGHVGAGLGLGYKLEGR